MHLSEFADPKTYGLPADGMAAVLNQLERILEDDSTRALRPKQRPENRRKNLIDEWRRDGTKRQHLSPRRSQ